MEIHKSFRPVILLYFLISLVYLVGIINFSNAEISLSRWGGVIVASLIEMALVLLLHIFILKFKNIYFRQCLGILLFLSVLLAYYSQGYSIYLSGSIINIIAIENAEDIQWIITDQLIYSGLVVFIYLSISIIIINRIDFSLEKFKFSRFYYLIFVCMLLFVVAVQVNLNRHQVERKTKFPFAMPATQLITSYGRAIYNNPPKIIKIIQYWFFRKANKIQNDYYFNKPTIYHNNPGGRFIENKPSEYNLIVFFVEGLSTRFVSGYGSPFLKITPNLDYLLIESLIFNNYFNHTAATFRGLQGQLNSSYPSAPGPSAWSTSEGDSSAKYYSTLPNILSKFGYQTFFISPHNNRLNNMLKAMDFDTVYSAAESSQMFLKSNLAYAKLDDAALIDSIIGFLKGRNEAGKPFFLATYNVGTHAFRSGPQNGGPFQFNSTLNRINEFDRQFGTFLDYFKNSQWVDNTILVVTSDHATYHDPSTLRAIEKQNDFKPYFVDKIPLIVRFPKFERTGIIDAKGRTSLDFAPTVLDLLDIRSIDNSFMGSSLLDSKPKYPHGMALISGEKFFIIQNEARRDSELMDNELNSYKSLIDDVGLYHKLEAIDKIAPAPTR